MSERSGGPVQRFGGYDRYSAAPALGSSRIKREPQIEICGLLRAPFRRGSGGTGALGSRGSVGADGRAESGLAR